MTKCITKNNNSVLSSAPTGCAASLIGGATHNRLMSIPVGQKFTKGLTALSITNINRLKDLVQQWAQCFAFFMDEDSMMGRPFWGWCKFRIEEFHTMCNKISNIVTSHDMAAVHQRSWGGIPLLYSFGDVQQLPPMAMKGMHDITASKSATSGDASGKIAIHEFMYPTDISNTNSLVVVMDKVMRQRDPVFLSILKNMETGSLSRDQIDVLLSRRLQNIDVHERLPL